jgi:hypothetical protein
MTRVYVPNRGGHDYSPASKFGEIVYVTEGYLDRWAVNQMYREWIRVLEGSTPDDYILETSLNTLCSVGAACFSLKHGRLNLLLFRDGEYVERKLLIGELLNEKST